MTGKRLLLAGLAATLAFTVGVTLAYRPVSAQTPSCYVEKYDLNDNQILDRADYDIAEGWYMAGDLRVDFDGSGAVVKELDLKPMALHFQRCVFGGDDGGGTVGGEAQLAGSLSVAASAAPAATGGPDAFGYTFKDNLEAGCPNNFTDIRGLPGATNLTLGDDAQTTVQIGFSFPYYGNSYTSANLGSNGFLAFPPNTATTLGNQCPFPSTTSPNDVIAMLWDDLYPPGGGTITAGTLSPCPGGRGASCWAVQFFGVPHFINSTPDNTFQTFLYPDGRIEMQFTVASESGSSSTSGIENSTGTIGLNYGCNSGYLAGLPKAVYFLPPGVTSCLPTAGGGGDPVDPNRQLGKQVHLPILNFQGQDDVCRTWIEVQVIGPEFSKAVLVTWGEPGFCPPQCAGPLKVECTGLLKPGSTWNFLGSQVPTGSKGGMLFKFTAKQISEIDPTFGGEDDIVADYMCETLFFGVVGDCDDWRRFKKAYNEGLEFAGLNMRAASGLGFLAVDVLRHCPGDVTPGVEVSSKYNGIAGDHLGSFDPVYGGYGFYVPLLYADKAGFNSVMYIQNGGLECRAIEIWFKAQDDCLRARICEIFTLAPGETYQFDASDCVGPDWQGSAWLRSTQPLGIVVDIIGRDVLMTYVGEPASYEYTYDPEDPGDDDVFSMGDQMAFGPLMYSEYQGWDTGVQVQNLSPVVNAKVKVYFLDRSGDIITTLVDWICPRGSQTFFLPVVADLPGSWVGSIRVESQEWWTPGSPAVSAPDIVGVATLIKYGDAARTTTTEALAYNLLPEHKIYRWQIGAGGGGVFSGVGLIAIPSLLKDLEGTGVTSEIAIANVIPKPGFTDFAIFIYDQNGLIDYVCQKLNEKQVEYIDLQTWGYVNPGFKGSAIISAVFWEHDVFDNDGVFVRNLLGLGAVAVERTGTRLGEDVPGDEAAGARGIPFSAPGGKRDFDWEGPNLPNCPGIGRIPPTL